jgi:hypothetical protein
MATTCPECGAAVPEGGTCRDNFHALLLLESRIPGGPGNLAHFYAVASYGLQHPGSMNFTAATAEGLRAAVSDALDRRATVADIRRRVGRRAEGPRRVTRRAGDLEAAWHRGQWPLTVADVLTAEAEQGAYGARVERWARSVRETLDAALGAREA